MSIFPKFKFYPNSILLLCPLILARYSCPLGTGWPSRSTPKCKQPHKKIQQNFKTKGIIMTSRHLQWVFLRGFAAVMRFQNLNPTQEGVWTWRKMIRLSVKALPIPKAPEAPKTTPSNNPPPHLSNLVPKYRFQPTCPMACLNLGFTGVPSACINPDRSTNLFPQFDTVKGQPGQPGLGWGRSRLQNRPTLNTTYYLYCFWDSHSARLGEGPTLETSECSLGLKLKQHGGNDISFPECLENASIARSE